MFAAQHARSVGGHCTHSQVIHTDNDAGKRRTQHRALCYT